MKYIYRERERDGVRLWERKRGEGDVGLQQ